MHASNEGLHDICMTGSGLPELGNRYVAHRSQGSITPLARATQVHSAWHDRFFKGRRGGFKSDANIKREEGMLRMVPLRAT